jgi:hypothetical protein
MMMPEAYILTEIRIHPRLEFLGRFRGAAIWAFNGDNFNPFDGSAVQIWKSDNEASDEEFQIIPASAMSNNTGWTTFVYWNEEEHGDVAEIEFYGVPAAYADDIINVTVDGVRVVFPDQRPVVINGRTLVPVRGVFELMGFDVDWDADTNTAVITNADYEIRITLDSNIFTVNGASHSLDVPAQSIGGRTMVPIRLPLESVGYYLEWDRFTQTVVISSEPIEKIIPDYIVIRGVQYSTQLTEIDLSDLNLTDEEIVPLQYMTNLRRLDMCRNWVTDLSPVSGLTNLTHLYAGFNRITDLTPLANMTQLTHLWLENIIRDTVPERESRPDGRNQISDISPLAGLINLRELHLGANQISDLTPLVNITRLRVLYLWRNQISDISPLAGMTNLSWLSLWSNQIRDLTPLSDMTEMTHLWLDSNQISDISPLANMRQLRHVTLRYMREGARITDWSPVDHVAIVDGRP